MAMADSTTSEKAAPDEEMPLPEDPRSVFLGGLFFLACIAAAYIAWPVVLPVVLAIVLKLLLQPLVRVMERVRIPRALASVLSILLLLGALAGIGTILASPASDLVRNFPQTLGTVQEKFSSFKEPIERAKEVMGRLGLTFGEGQGAGGAVAGSVAGALSSFGGHLIEVLLLLFYMLAFGETFMRRLVEILPRFQDKKQAVEISLTVERDISAYLVTITIINAIVGTLCGLMMWLFGVPGGPFWGVIAFCFNYVPILGPLGGVALFGVVGLATLGAAWFSLLPAACYLAIHVAEGEFITPMLLARRFTLNPIAVMIALIFWYWMWGVVGAVLSVPLLAITKILCDRIRPFHAVGHLLAG